jgi:hypothetical protein
VVGELKDVIDTKQLDGRMVTFVDLNGLGTYRTPARNPHAGGMPPMARPKGGKVQSPFTFDPPAGWAPMQPLPEFSVAAYEVTEGKRRATITLSQVGGGDIANIVRWRGQIGLPPATPAEIRKDMGSLDVAGFDAKYVDLANPRSAKAVNRILGVIVPTDGGTWYVKMAGPDDFVATQEVQFKAFVRSFKLAPE